VRRWCSAVRTAEPSSGRGQKQTVSLVGEPNHRLPQCFCPSLGCGQYLFRGSLGAGAGPNVRDRLCQIIRKHNLDPKLVKAYAVDFCSTKTLRRRGRGHCSRRGCLDQQCFLNVKGEFGERREWRHVSAESSCDFLENDRVVASECGGKSWATRQDLWCAEIPSRWYEQRKSPAFRSIRSFCYGYARWAVSGFSTAGLPVQSVRHASTPNFYSHANLMQQFRGTVFPDSFKVSQALCERAVRLAQRSGEFE